VGKRKGRVKIDTEKEEGRQSGQKWTEHKTKKCHYE